MADREIIRENHVHSTDESGSNLILGIVIALVLGVIIYFIVNGSFNNNATTDTNGGTIDVNLNTPGNTNNTNDGNTTTPGTTPDTSTDETTNGTNQTQ